MFFLAEAEERDNTRTAVVVPAGVGRLTVICGGTAALRSALLRSLSGLDRRRGRSAGLPDGALSGRADPEQYRRAYLPAPGEEIFVGTTVGEELSFAQRSGAGGREHARNGVLLPGESCFEALVQRSVWDLSAAERRLLLLHSQAAAGPGLWLLDEPLARLDGENRRTVLGYFRQCKHDGVVLVAAVGEPASLAPGADYYVTLEGQGFGAGVWDQAGRPAPQAAPGQAAAEPGLWFTAPASQARGLIEN